jgi:acyl-ACP thioesterase
MLEIHRYLPPAFLKKNVGEMDIDEFLRALAQARYIQELEENVVARAVYKVFGD